MQTEAHPRRVGKVFGKQGSQMSRAKTKKQMSASVPARSTGGDELNTGTQTRPKIRCSELPTGRFIDNFKKGRRRKPAMYLPASHIRNNR